MIERKTGDYETLGSLNHFIPYPLPPSNPSFQMDYDLIELYGKAMHKLGHLNEMARRIPNIQRFIKAYITKEALLSSEIEGIQTTLVDVLSEPSSDFRPNKETQLVLNYTKSLEVALDLIQKQNMPLVSRVILAAHQTLMQGGDGDKASPGSYRQQSVRVGDHIPPTAPHIPQLIKDLETYMNTDTTTLPLLKAGFAHVQFETIHPFLDGNGRIGRLLIVLMLLKDGLLNEAIIYPSYAFKKHQMAYYVALDNVRSKGDFEGWIRFYLQSLIESAEDAWARAKDIELLEKCMTKTIQQSSLFVKTRDDALNLLSLLFQFPVIRITDAANHLGKSYNSVNTLMERFQELEILAPGSDQKRNRTYLFKGYLDVLEQVYG
ncbi:MAG: Fic family protein [Alphaproteobacteria bacterium]|nr:Fic family protein [Alphaproteobacteria bacterium]